MNRKLCQPVKQRRWWRAEGDDIARAEWEAYNYNFLRRKTNLKKIM